MTCFRFLGAMSEVKEVFKGMSASKSKCMVEMAEVLRNLVRRKDAVETEIKSLLHDDPSRCKARPRMLAHVKRKMK